MKKAFTVLAVLLLATSLSFAADDDKLDKVSGCLMEIGDDYILTDANGVKFEIDGMNDQLKANIGHVIEVTGEFEGRSGDDDHHALKIDAKQLKVLANECSANAVGQSAGTATGIGASTAKPATSAQVTTQGAATQSSGTAVTTTSSAPGTVTQQTTTTTTTTTKVPEGSTVKTGAAVLPESDMGERIVTGCVSRSGGHFVLTEQGTGTTYRLDGEGDKLDDHVGHMVTLSGEAEKLNEASSSGAQMEFDVKEVRFVSDSCAATPKQ